jgi:hypothetical protein
LTTIRQLITDAMRESGILAVGVSPDAEEHEEALRHVHRLLRALFGNELGERLRTVNYGSSNLTNSFAVAEDMAPDIESSYVPSNCRLILNNTEASTVYLPPNPQDGARIAVVDNRGNLATYNLILNGNGRQIEDASSVTLATNLLNREWFYRADLAKWVRVTDPDADDESPLPLDFDDYMTTLLAFRLNPRYGAETSANQMATLGELRRKFRARYRQSNEEMVEDGLLFLSSNPTYLSLQFDFERG